MQCIHALAPGSTTPAAHPPQGRHGQLRLWVQDATQQGARCQQELGPAGEAQRERQHGGRWHDGQHKLEEGSVQAGGGRSIALGGGGGLRIIHAIADSTQEAAMEAF